MPPELRKPFTARLYYRAKRPVSVHGLGAQRGYRFADAGLYRWTTQITRTDFYLRVWNLVLRVEIGR